MTGWRLGEVGAVENRSDRWRRLPVPAMHEAHGPEDYIPHDALLDAIDTALTLGQPLILTGEPGSGKTEVGDFVAWRLGLDAAIRYDAKSSMSSRDLLYSYDSLGRFHAAQEAARTQSEIDPRAYISFVGLGLAILRANAANDAAHLVADGFRHVGPTRSVVLIDEIDKAPRDTPNDLLSELERMAFVIPELNAEISAPKEMRPVVILTSNSEKALPDAFLRRCVYYHMPELGRDELLNIAAARIPDLPRDSALLGDAVDLFEKARRLRLRKKPGAAELIGFALALRRLDYDSTDSLKPADENWARRALVTLFKSQDDQATGHDFLMSWKRG